MLTDKLLPALAAAVLLASPLTACADSEGLSLPHAGNDIRSHASLQRGARNFMNYCSGCHSAQFVRYNRIGADIGIGEQELVQNLMFTSEHSFDTIKSALSADDARKWFGTVPPDLSLMARARGPDYLFAFIRGFYLDPSRPTGANNAVMPGTAMPYITSELQGTQRAVMRPAAESDSGVAEIEKLEPATPGSMTPEQFEEFARDTTNFLEYIGEPVQVQRRDMGVWVTLFLLVFAGFAFMLKREYFRDIH